MPNDVILLRRVVTAVVAGGILLFCLHYLVTRFEWREAITVLAGARMFLFLGIGSVTVLLYWLLRTLRWYWMLRFQEVRVPFLNLFWMTSLSLAFSIVTPFQSGEMMKVEWMKRRGLAGRACGYGIFAVERGMDLAVVAGAAVVSGFAEYVGMALYEAMAWISVVIILALAGGGWFFRKKHLKGATGEFLLAVRASLKTPWQGLVIFALTVLAWMMTAAGWQVCLVSIGMDVGYVRALVLTLWVTLINILSMVPGAVGVSEVSIAELLVFWGYPVSLSQAAALSLRGYSLLILACGAVLFVLNQSYVYFSGYFFRRKRETKPCIVSKK